MNAQTIATYSPLESAVKWDANGAALQPTPASQAFSTSELQISTPRSASLLFIDQTVEDYQTLISAAAPGTEIQILDTAQDAISQITQTLLGRSDISSLHIVSHGASSRLQFSTKGLTLDSLSTYGEQIESWAGALTVDADILLYGCNVAQGDLGQAFVQILSQLTGADVAASTDVTGKAGNWLLELQQGRIETALPFDANILSSYQHNLFGSDFDDNGASDVVTYDYLTGGVQLQLMGEVFSASTIDLGSLGYGWQLADMADFDANNYVDMVWQNVATGETALCLMDGVNISQFVALPSIPAGSDWRIVGVQDFDANGTPDLLWRSQLTETTGFWLMNGTAMAGIQVLPQRSYEWVVSGVADVNNNATPDILWRNTFTGESEFWLMSGANVVGTIALPTQNSQWVIHELADWNNDSFTDVLWRNYATGETSIWTLNSGSYANTFNVAVPGNGLGWTILDSCDLDFNGTSDLIVHNYLTGQTAAWMMSGTAYLDTSMNVIDDMAGTVDIVAQISKAKVLPA